MYGDRASEVLISTAEKTINTDIVRIGNISDRVCYGHIFLVKRSIGDTIFVCFGGQQPAAKNYHVILTDTFPIFDDTVVIGDVSAVGSAAGGLLSVFARGGYFPDKA
jgi:hypothetical protein